MRRPEILRCPDDCSSTVEESIYWKSRWLVTLNSQIPANRGCWVAAAFTMVRIGKVPAQSPGDPKTACRSPVAAERRA
jgi:hypothetical protein